MENLVKKELVRVASNNPYGFNRDLWREHRNELLIYFDMQAEDMPEEDMVMCCFFTENIPIGIDLYTVLTGEDIFKEVDLLEKDYLDLDIAGFTVSLEIDLNGNLIHASMGITLQDGGTFIDTLLNDVIYLEDIFYERAIEYYKTKQDASFKYLELLIDQLVTDENVTEEDKRKFLIDVMERLNKLEGEK